MARKRVAIALILFFTILAVFAAVPLMLYPDYAPYSWWLFYEAAIYGKHYDRCWWPDDFTDHENATSLYDFEYDEELDCYLKQRSG